MWGLLSAGLGLLGNMFASDSAERTNDKNVALQRETNAQNINFARETAKNSIQWRVEDAKKAGLHPIYALGGSYAPSPVLNAPQRAVVGHNPLAGIAEALLSAKQLKLLDSQIALNKARAVKELKKSLPTPVAKKVVRHYVRSKPDHVSRMYNDSVTRRVSHHTHVSRTPPSISHGKNTISYLGKKLQLPDYFQKDMLDDVANAFGDNIADLVGVRVWLDTQKIAGKKRSAKIKKIERKIRGAKRMGDYEFTKLVRMKDGSLREVKWLGNKFVKGGGTW